jgi:alpha-galactosidase
MSVSLLFTSLAFCPFILALVRPHSVGKLPALGWNSWNAYGCNINATVIMGAANAMVDLGFMVRTTAFE